MMMMIMNDDYRVMEVTSFFPHANSGLMQIHSKRVGNVMFCLLFNEFTKHI